MLEEWYSTIELPLTFGQFEQLPQNPAELASTFLLGNESSTLWHWRAGFRCLPYPGSMRVVREQVAREGNAKR